MKPFKKTAVAVGAMFIVATVTSLISTALTNGVIDGPDYLAKVSAHGDRVITAALFAVAAGASCVAIPALLFPVLKRHNEGVALGYLGIRILEATALLLSAVSLLLLVTLSREYVGAGAATASYYPAAGALLQGLHDWAFPLDPVIFGAGALLLYSLLYRSRLVPRWLSAWGLGGAALVFAFALMRMFGGGSAAMALPIAVQEMALAAWLIVKGFSLAAAPGSEALGAAKVPALGPLG